MLEQLNLWYQRYFSDQQAVLLIVLLVIAAVLVLLMGKMLAPLFAALIIAYLLETPTYAVEQRLGSRIWAVSIVFSGFIAFMILLLFGLLPILSNQLSQFIQEVPNMISNGQALLLKLPYKYPELISESLVTEISLAIKSAMTAVGQNVLSISLASIPVVISILVYLVLVPVMIFFLLKDKSALTAWFTGLLPAERALLASIWCETDGQIGNYIRGKCYEIIIVFAVAFIFFRWMGLNYATLLALLVGLSVLIPYIGATVITLPVVLVGYFQWGVDSQFMWLVAGYIAIQFLDGNVLVPVLFSDAVNLHPIAIIVAILVFGGLWGFWGVFFAIPLATLVKALMMIWPTTLSAGGSSDE